MELPEFNNLSEKLSNLKPNNIISTNNEGLKFWHEEKTSALMLFPTPV
jgi:hypothetical protein